jgi:glycosyltransferase involved in cell wall biosynthesis
MENSSQIVGKNLGQTAQPGRRLRIAQVAPLYESVPPKLYGGTERVVSYLTEELVRRGHDVTLYASGDSRTAARLEAGHPESLRLAGLTPIGPGLQLPMLSDLYEQPDRFDVIHAHIDYWVFPYVRMAPVPPTVSTMHGRLDVEALRPIYEHFLEPPVISISDAQRTPLPFMNWVGTVYHGLPLDLLSYNPKGGKYLAFLGRISPEKRPELAIEVATRAGLPLKIAAKVDAADREYYERTVKPLLSRPGVEFIGEINDVQKSEFLGNALALLFPIEWPEPFGLVMIEAMACGTPVIARPYGSVPEVIRHGVSGLIAHEVDEMVAAVKQVESISRAACRAEFESRFTASVMAQRYEALYERVIEQSRAL